MNNEKIIEFYKKLEQDSNVKSNLKKKIQHVRNEDDLRKIIDNEIIPLSRKMGMSFTSDELMNYERHVSQVLNEIELENISGGASNKNLFLGGLVSLMFLGLSHLSTVQAVNLDQVIHTTRNQIESIEYSPDKTNETNPTNKPILSTPKTELMPSTEAIISTKNQQVPDQQQTTDLNQDAEVNPLKRPRLNQLPTDSTDITDSTKVQPELNQSQSTTTEETAITAQPANTVDGVDETYTVTTDTQEEQAGLNRKQVISATKELTDATQTTPDTTTPNPTTSDGTATVFWQNLINQLSNNKKLYCLEALNLCNPFIEKETEVIENVRLYNGYTNSIGIRGKSYTRNYSKDEGMGSANLMKILFPSTAGELNITTTSDSITTLNECEPSPEDIANLMVCLFKYRNNDPETVVRFTLLNKWKEFGEGFVRGKYNILKGSNPPNYDYDGFFKRTLSKNSTFAKQYKGVLIDIKEKLSKITRSYFLEIFTNLNIKKPPLIYRGLFLFFNNFFYFFIKIIST